MLYQRKSLIMYMTAADAKSANVQLDRFLEQESIIAVFCEVAFIGGVEWGGKLADRLSKATFPVYLLADDPGSITRIPGLAPKRIIAFPGPVPRDGLTAVADCVVEEIARRSR